MWKIYDTMVIAIKKGLIEKGVLKKKIKNTGQKKNF